MAPRVLDLRSDTLTHPTDEMREAMRNARVGDDAYGEDPTVNELQERAARMLKKEAALFLPSGTMANQVAVFVHSKRRGEVLLEQESHIFIYENGGPALLSGVQCRPVEGQRGVFTALQAEEKIRGWDSHEPPTTLVAIENTHNRAGGTVWTPAQTKAVAAVAHRHGIPVHVDGARLFNSAVAQGVAATRLAQPADSVMFSLSKGLSAPVGSLLCGSEGFIHEAKWVRQLFGGGMRQSGVLAAAGIVALKTMVNRLQEDHENAQRLAVRLAKLPGLRVDLASVQTNIVMVDVSETGWGAPEFVRRLNAQGVFVNFESPRRVRFVTHRHIARSDVEEVVRRVEKTLSPRKNRTRGAAASTR